MILPDEIAALEHYGVAKIYTPEDGARLGLTGIVEHLIKTIGPPPGFDQQPQSATNGIEDSRILAKLISVLQHPEDQRSVTHDELRSRLMDILGKRIVPVIGITGSGGCGKSSIDR